MARDMASEMTAADVLGQLAGHATLGSAPPEELAWLAAHGTIRHIATGGVVTAKGAQVEGMFVVLSGRIAIFIDRGTGLHKVMEWVGGDVTGLLPFSRLSTPPGDSVAQEPTVLLAVPRDQIRGMTRDCHVITSILVHTMLDRTRAFTTSDLHDEKMVSLGKLSAGLAHELNNPASAIERSARILQSRLEDSERASRALGALSLTDAQLAAAGALQHTCMAARDRGVRSPIEEADREEAIAGWLADHGLGDSSADALSESAVTVESLDRLAGVVDGPALSAVLLWAATGCSVRALASEIQEAAGGISRLVAAIKGFTHMDQATVAEPVDLAQGLSNTVAVLKAKARSKQVGVVIEVDSGIPRVRGFAGELNQIWANLIDNALDAVAESGRVEVRASRDQQRVVVQVIDNGPGIPAQIRERIFDPFFTTKPVGVGTGLGLDIVRRLVRHNDGEISVESAPGRTEFRVVLQAAGDGSESGAR